MPPVQLDQVTDFIASHTGPYHVETYRLDESGPGMLFEHSRKVFELTSPFAVMDVAGSASSIRIRAGNHRRLDIEARHQYSEMADHTRRQLHNHV